MAWTILEQDRSNRKGGMYFGVPLSLTAVA